MIDGVNIEKNITEKFMKFLNKTIARGLYLLVFLLPIQTRWIIKAGETEYATYSLYGTDMLLILVLLLFVVYRIFNLIKSSKFPEAMFGASKVQNLLTFGLFLASFISIFFAIDKMLAFYKLSWLILGLGLFLLIVRVNYNRLKLIYALLSGIFLQAIFGSWQFLTQSNLANKWLGLALHNGADLGASVIETAGADGIGERWLRAYGGLDHPNILGGILIIGIFLLINFILIDKKSFRITNKIKIFTSYFLLLTFTTALFFSFSRAAWLALTIGIGAMLIEAVFKKNYQAQKSILQAVLIFGLVGFILFFQFSNLLMARLYGERRLEIKSYNERLESIKNSLPIIKKNWAAGAGIGNYTLALNRQRPGQESFYYQPAHNVFLLVWSEAGIIGLLFLVGLIIFVFMRLLRRPEYGSSRDDNGVGILVALVVLMTFDHWLWSLHFGVLFFWLVLGVIVIREDKKLNFPTSLC